MATYGPNAGFVPFTGFSPTLGAADAIVPVTSGNAQFNGMTQADDDLSKVLFVRGNRGVRKLLLTLLGAAPGATATETFTRVQAQQATFSPTDYGGLVPIETVNQVNRVTTSTDVTNVTAALTRNPAAPYVADSSGAAGGGKLGF